MDLYSISNSEARSLVPNGFDSFDLEVYDDGFTINFVRGVDIVQIDLGRFMKVPSVFFSFDIDHDSRLKASKEVITNLVNLFKRKKLGGLIVLNPDYLLLDYCKSKSFSGLNEVIHSYNDVLSFKAPSSFTSYVLSTESFAGTLQFSDNDLSFVRPSCFESTATMFDNNVLNVKFYNGVDDYLHFSIESFLGNPCLNYIRRSDSFSGNRLGREVISRLIYLAKKENYSHFLIKDPFDSRIKYYRECFGADCDPLVFECLKLYHVLLK